MLREALSLLLRKLDLFNFEPLSSAVNCQAYADGLSCVNGHANWSMQYASAKSRLHISLSFLHPRLSVQGPYLPAKFHENFSEVDNNPEWLGVGEIE